jgi:hypothetical protein
MASGINKGFQTSYLQSGGGQSRSNLDSGVNTVARRSAQERMDNYLGLPQPLDAYRAAAGLAPQGDIGTPTADSLVSSARVTNPNAPTPPIVGDVMDFFGGIYNRHQKTANQMQANRLKNEMDLGRFGGFGGDVTGLEPFGGSGQFIEIPTESMEDYDDDLGFATQSGDSAQNAITNLEAGLKQSSEKDDPLEPFGGAGRAINDDLDGDSEEAFDPYGGMIEDQMRAIEALKGNDPDAKKTEDYMKEFAEATGISIDGKADKSQALMAFGLALMQNKAGKGFDVSKALSALGEAGTAAAPAFQKAKETARANRIAAGKYGLQEKKAAAASRTATLSAAQQRLQDLNLKQMDYFGQRVIAQEKNANELRMKNIDAELEFQKSNRERIEKGEETKGFYNREPEYTNLKIRMGMSDNGNRAVYANPVNDGKDIALRYVAMQRAQNAMDKTDALLAEIQKSDVPAFEILKGRVSEILVAGGADPKAVFKERGISAESEVNALLQVLILENKRFATQETGNGVSNQDRNDLATAFGQIDILGNPGVARRSLQEIRTIFGRPMRQIDSELESFMNNKDMYRNETDYINTINSINKTLGDSPFRPRVTKGQGGTTRYAIGDY